MPKTYPHIISVSEPVNPGPSRKFFRLTRNIDMALKPPTNLFPGTSQDNADDMKQKGRTTLGRYKTHCKHGHELTPANLYFFRGNRICLECRRRRGRESVAKKRAVERAENWAGTGI